VIQQVYVAGSYTADTRTRTLQNIMRALVAAVDLTKRGYHPIVPHTAGSHHLGWEDAMDRCYRTIKGLSPTRDCLAMLPGWEQSRGARAERELALEIGIPIYDLADLSGEQVVHL
jgi:hypothetical protein